MFSPAVPSGPSMSVHSAVFRRPDVSPFSASARWSTSLAAQPSPFQNVSHQPRWQPVPLGPPSSSILPSSTSSPGGQPTRRFYQPHPPTCPVNLSRVADGARTLSSGGGPPQRLSPGPCGCRYPEAPRCRLFVVVEQDACGAHAEVFQLRRDSPSARRCSTRVLSTVLSRYPGGRQQSVRQSRCRVASAKTPPPPHNRPHASAVRSPGLQERGVDCRQLTGRMSSRNDLPWKASTRAGPSGAASSLESAVHAPFCTGRPVGVAAGAAWRLI